MTTSMSSSGGPRRRGPCLRRCARCPATACAAASRSCAGAGLLAAITIAGQALLTYGVDGDDFAPYDSGWPRFGQFLSGIPFGLGFAGLMFAASFIVAAHAARLDVEQSLLPD